MPTRSFLRFRAGVREGGGESHMANISGVKITDLTACGTSEDGEHVWITHRLGDGTEYPLVYPFEAVGYLITVLTETARSANCVLSHCVSSSFDFSSTKQNEQFRTSVPAHRS